MRNLAAAAALVVTLVAGALAAPARATSVVAVDLPSLAARAAVVVEARVIDQRVVDEGGRVVTYTTLVVVRALKGATAGQQLIVYQPGALDGVRVRWVDGAHHFHAGDDVVLFGERFVHAGKAVVVAMAPGVGVFSRDASGALVEDGVPEGGAVPAARRFASVDALFAAAHVGGAP